MSKQTQGTMLMVGALAGTVGLVAFVALMVLGGYAFSPALFLAILVAGAAALFLMIGFHRKPTPTLAMQPPVAKPAAKPAETPVAAPVAAAAVEAAPAPVMSPPTPAPTPEPVVSAAAPMPEGNARPVALSGPRDGGADDLKRIKGIGPKLEELCNSMGFYHFDQIAHWTEAEVAWVDDNLEGFKGRVTRDTWVEQARLLATGGETEFSKKVDKGSVY